MLRNVCKPWFMAAASRCRLGSPLPACQGCRPRRLLLQVPYREGRPPAACRRRSGTAFAPKVERTPTFPVSVAQEEVIMLGQRLQQLRANAGLSQPELARRVGVSVGTLQDWETDAGEPGSGALGKLAAALGVPQEELSAGLAEAQQAREGR